MLDLCSQCGKPVAASDVRCPHCNADWAVALPGTAAVGVDDGTVPLPAPAQPDPFAPASSAPAAAEHPVAREASQIESSVLEELFSDFDPMEEFAASAGSGAPTGAGPGTATGLGDGPTLGGLNLTPPPAQPVEPIDDVLAFIDTGHEKKATTPEPEIPSIVSELGLTAIAEVAAPPGVEPPSLAPSATEPPTLGVESDAPAAPMIAGALRDAPSAPATAERPRAIGRKRLRLLVIGGVAGALIGVGAFFFLGKDTPARGKKAEAVAPATADRQPAKTASADAAKEKPAKKEATPEKEAMAAKDAAAQEGDAESPTKAAAGTDEGATAEAKPAEETEGKTPAEGDGEAVADAQEEGAEATAEGGEAAPPSFFAEAEALEREEKWEEALAAYLRAAGPDKGPMDEAHLRRSRIYLRLGDRPRALLEARRAVSDNPDRLDARLHLGGIFEAMGSVKDARETYEAAYAKNQDDPVLLERLARIYLTSGAAWRAIEILEPHVGPKAPVAVRRALGEAYLGASAWARAEAVLAPIAREPGVAYPLARALVEQGKLRQALPHLERAAAEEEVDPVVHRHLGYAYKELRRRADAARAFRAYLQAAPDALDRPEIEDEIASLTR